METAADNDHVEKKKKKPLVFHVKREKVGESLSLMAVSEPRNVEIMVKEEVPTDGSLPAYDGGPPADDGGPPANDGGPPSDDGAPPPVVKEEPINGDEGILANDGSILANDGAPPPVVKEEPIYDDEGPPVAGISAAPSNVSPSVARVKEEPGIVKEEPGIISASSNVSPTVARVEEEPGIKTEPQWQAEAASAVLWEDRRLPFAQHAIIGGKDAPTDPLEIQARLDNAPPQLREIATMLLYIKAEFYPLMKDPDAVTESKLKNSPDMEDKCRRVFDDLQLEHQVVRKPNQNAGKPQRGMKIVMYVNGVLVCTVRTRSLEEAERKGGKDVFCRLVQMCLRSNYIKLTTEPILALNVGRHSAILADSFRYDKLVGFKDLEKIGINKWEVMQDVASSWLPPVLVPVGGGDDDDDGSGHKWVYGPDDGNDHDRDHDHDDYVSFGPYPGGNNLRGYPGNTEPGSPRRDDGGRRKQESPPRLLPRKERSHRDGALPMNPQRFRPAAGDSRSDRNQERGHSPPTDKRPPPTDRSSRGDRIKSTRSELPQRSGTGDGRTGSDGRIGSDGRADIDGRTDRDGRADRDPHDRRRSSPADRFPRTESRRSGAQTVHPKIRTKRSSPPNGGDGRTGKDGCTDRDGRTDRDDRADRDPLDRRRSSPADRFPRTESRRSGAQTVHPKIRTERSPPSSRQKSKLRQLLPWQTFFNEFG